MDLIVVEKYKIVPKTLQESTKSHLQVLVGICENEPVKARPGTVSFHFKSTTSLEGVWSKQVNGVMIFLGGLEVAYRRSVFTHRMDPEIGKSASLKAREVVRNNNLLENALKPSS